MTAIPRGRTVPLATIAAYGTLPVAPERHIVLRTDLNAAFLNNVLTRFETEDVLDSFFVFRTYGSTSTASSAIDAWSSANDCRRRTGWISLAPTPAGSELRHLTRPVVRQRAGCASERRPVR